MPVTGTIPDNYQIEFDNTFTLEVQQTVSRLRQCATVKTGCTGKAETHNRIDPEEMEDQTERLAKTNGTELKTKVRWVFPRAAQKTTYLDEWDEDLLGHAILPTGDATRVHVAASGRKCDARLLDGIIGTNYEGTEDSITPVELPASQKIAVNFHRDGATTNTGLTLAKLIAAKGKFGKNEVFGQEQKAAGDMLCMAVAQAQLDDLLYDVEQVGSADYNKVRALVDGEVDYFMGIWFKRIEAIPIKEVGQASIQTNPMWTKSQVCFDVWKDIRTRISIRDDLSEAIQIRSKKMVGACRRTEKGVVLIDNLITN